MDLSIIIVNYNVKEFLENLLHSIFKATKTISTEIIVIDNASDDGSVELIKSKFPSVNLIDSQVNLGFSKANNLGLKIAKGKYLLLLNPDTIVQEDTFTSMIEFMEKNPDAGMAGCKILNPDGSIQLGCRRSFPGPWTSFCKVTGLSSLFPNSKIFARYNLTYLDENKTYEVDAISGSFMILRKEVYQNIGGLDEDFFMYGEDLDWCFRVQKSGLKVYYVHTTQIIHYKGESTKRSSIDEIKHFYQAMHLFVKKHLSSSLLVEIILRSAILLRELVAFIARDKAIIISIILDFFFFNLSLFLGEKIYTSITTWQGFNREALLIIYLVPGVIQISIGLVFRAYKKEGVSVIKIIPTVIAGFLVITSLTFFFKDFAYSRVVVLFSYSTFFVISLIWRIVYKLMFERGGIKNARINTLLVGNSSMVTEIAEKLKSKKTSLYSIVGIIAKSNREVGETINGYKIIGSLQNIRKVINETKANEVIFSSSEMSYKEIMKVVSDCKNENVEFKLVGESLEFLVGKSSVNLLKDIPVVDIKYDIAEPINRFVKRGFDIFFSTLLMLLFPILVLFKGIFKKEIFSDMLKSLGLIFAGEKSFVGPKDKTLNSEYFLGKPGVTGIWFVEDELEEDKMNLFYAKNQNIWLDLEILGKTVLKLLNRE